MKDILKKNTKILAIVAFFLVLCNVLNVIHPFIVKQILDIDLKAENMTNTLLTLFFIYITIHLFFLVSKDARNHIMNKTLAKILKELREKLFYHVLKWDMTTYQKYNSSEIYTRLTADIDHISSLFLGTLQVLLNDVIYIGIMVAFMFAVDIRLAMIGSSAILLTAIISYVFTHHTAKANKGILDKRDQENKQYSEMYHKNKLTYLFSLQKKNVEKIGKTLQEELTYRKRFIFIESFIYPIAITIQALAIYVILKYAFSIHMTISLGSIYLVIHYIQQCRTPLNEIFNQLEEIQSSFMSLQRVRKLFKEQGREEIEKGEKIENLKGDIEFANVTIQYGKHEVLKNISFYIKQGNKVTIAGKTGVGKTTLVSMLMRLYPIAKGTILIGGKDISKIRIQDIRKNISYISQTPYILEDTLRNNLILGDISITEEQIRAAATKIGFEKLLENFKDGLEEKIEKNKLSYGQLQMIAFLRAILHKANIYIFDEPTSNIDLKTEDRIQKLMDTIAKESTVIIIAHRKSTIENSDKIIYLKDGQVDMIINKDVVIG